jgi:hypothetical protein
MMSSGRRHVLAQHVTSGALRRCTSMRHSSIGFLIMVLLLVVVAVFLLTPHEKHGASSGWGLPGQFWGSRP